MSAVDAAVVIASLVGLLALAGWIARRQPSTGDDYLGGRHLPAWTLGLGSLVYGPILALFLLAWRSRRADGRSAVAGALAGVGVNLALARLAPEVSWLWWNAAGCAAAWGVGHWAERARRPAPPPARPRPEPASVGTGGRHLAGLLVAEFLVILVLLAGLTLAVG